MLLPLDTGRAHLADWVLRLWYCRGFLGLISKQAIPGLFSGGCMHGRLNDTGHGPGG